MLKEEPVVENNIALQVRLTSAANHFVPKLEALLDSLKNHPLYTEHKETAEPINPLLNATAIAVYSASYYVSFCKKPFTLLGYLQHKLNYAEQRFNLSCYASNNKNVSKSDSPNEELYQTLKRWRDIICNDTGQPVYLIAAHDTLKEICTYLPKTKRELMLIKGFGKAKVDKYGEEIVDAVIDYCERYNIEGGAIPIKTSSKKTKAPSNEPPKPNTRDSTYALYKAGKTIAEIAVERNFAVQTIEGHIAAFIENGIEPITAFMDNKKYEAIAAVMKTKGEKNLSEMKEFLPNASFGEMRMVEAALKFEESKK